MPIALTDYAFTNAIARWVNDQWIVEDLSGHMTVALVIPNGENFRITAHYFGQPYVDHWPDLEGASEYAVALYRERRPASIQWNTNNYTVPTVQQYVTQDIWPANTDSDLCNDAECRLRSCVDARRREAFRGAACSMGGCDVMLTGRMAHGCASVRGLEDALCDEHLEVMLARREDEQERSYEGSSSRW